jgi:putative transposase
MMCELLGVSRSGADKASKRQPSSRQLEQERLMELIKITHEQSWGTYGVPRMHAELTAMGIKISPGRVERLMRKLGIQGVMRGKKKSTTRRGKDATLAPDRVDRNFASPKVNRLWVADFTYVRTDEGWAYVAAIQDVCSRVIVGYNVAERMTVDLVLDAFKSALQRRRPGKGLVHHSDQGSQYTALRFSQTLHGAGVAASMGSVGDAYDNAMAESWIGTLKAETLAGKRFKTRDEVALAVFYYVEAWYNPRRRHTSLDMLSPLDYERELGAA